MPPADVADVYRRAHRRQRRRRLMVLGVTLAMTSASGVVVVGTGVLLRSRTTAPPQTRQHLVGDVLLPEGKLVVQERSGPSLVMGTRVVGVTDFDWGHGVSPDGSRLLVSSGETEGSGIYRTTHLGVISIDGMATTLIAEASNTESLGPPFIWAPDGDRVAFGRSRWASDPTRSFPDEPAMEDLCVLTITSRDEACFPGARPVTGYAWSPDGQTLAVTGPGSSGLRLLHVGSGSVSEIMSPDDPALTAALAERGLPPADLLSEPAWSASGRLIAVSAGSAYVILASDGQISFVTLPIQNDYHRISWMPVSDRFAYSVGRSAVTGDATGSWELRLVEPLSGTDDVLFVLGPPAYVDGLAWSPTGQWIALSQEVGPGGNRISLVSPSSGEELGTLPVDGAVVAWSI